MNLYLRNHNTIWLFSILVLAFLLRIYDLSGESIWLDEGRSIDIARMSIPALIAENSLDFHPPLYSMLLHGWIKISGSSEFSTRFLSVLFSVLSLFILYRIGTNIFNRHIALYSTLLMTVSVFHLQYAQEVKSYALMLLLALLTYLYFIRILKKRHPVDMGFYVISSALLLYTHFLGISIILAQFIYVLCSLYIQVRDRRRSIISWLWIYVFIFILFLPWFEFLLSRTLALQQNFWVKEPDLLSLPQVLLIYSGTYTPFGIAVLVIFIGLIILAIRPGKETLASYQSSVKYPSLLLITWFLVPLTFPFIISLFSASIFMARITIGALPAFFLLVAIGLSNLNKPVVRKITLAVLVLLSLINVFRYYQETNKERWREAVTFVESNARRGEPVIIHEEYCLVNAFNYYARREDLNKIGFPPPGESITPSKIKELQIPIASCDRVWLVLSHSHDRDNLMVSYLQERFLLRLHQVYESRGFNSHLPYRGVELFLFQRSP